MKPQNGSISALASGVCVLSFMHTKHSRRRRRRYLRKDFRN